MCEVMMSASFGRQQGSVYYQSRCLVCCRLFCCWDHLLIHETKAHKLSILVCAICNKGFQSKRNLVTHLTEHLPLICQHCSVTLYSKSEMETHEHSEKHLTNLLPTEDTQQEIKNMTSNEDQRRDLDVIREVVAPKGSDLQKDETNSAIEISAKEAEGLQTDEKHSFSIDHGEPFKEGLKKNEEFRNDKNNAAVIVNSNNVEVALKPCFQAVRSENSSNDIENEITSTNSSSLPVQNQSTEFCETERLESIDEVVSERENILVEENEVDSVEDRVGEGYTTALEEVTGTPAVVEEKVKKRKTLKARRTKLINDDRVTGSKPLATVQPRRPSFADNVENLSPTQTETHSVYEASRGLISDRTDGTVFSTELYSERNEYPTQYESFSSSGRLQPIVCLNLSTKSLYNRSTPSDSTTSKEKTEDGLILRLSTEPLPDHCPLTTPSTSGLADTNLMSNRKSSDVIIHATHSAIKQPGSRKATPFRVRFADERMDNFSNTERGAFSSTPKEAIRESITSTPGLFSVFSRFVKSAFDGLSLSSSQSDQTGMNEFSNNSTPDAGPSAESRVANLKRKREDDEIIDVRKRFSVRPRRPLRSTSVHSSNRVVSTNASFVTSTARSHRRHGYETPLRSFGLTSSESPELENGSQISGCEPFDASLSDDQKYLGAIDVSH